MNAALSSLEETPGLACGASEAEFFVASRAQLASSPAVFHFVRCERCALIRLNPRVPATAIGTYYDPSYLPHRGASAWGRYAPLVERSEAAQDRGRVKRVRKAVALGPDARVLDVGCGRPTFLKALHNATGARCTGVDFSDHGWRDEPERWRDLTLLHGELATSSLTPGFDAITLWHALEHEYDPVSSLKRLHALTRPGGVLVVEVPNADSWTRRLHGDHWAGLHTPRHTTVYTPATLRAVIERAGWRIQQVLPYGTLDPFVLWWLGRQDRVQRDLSGDLSPLLPSFLAARILATPLLLLQRWISLGVQTAIAVRA